jgi:hypothetical protein
MWYEPGTGPSHTELRRRAEMDSVGRILHDSQRYALLLEATKQESNAPPQDVEQSQELDRISDDEQYQIKVLLRCRSRQQSRDRLKQPDTGAGTSTSRDEGRGWGTAERDAGDRRITHIGRHRSMAS